MKKKKKLGFLRIILLLLLCVAILAIVSLAIAQSDRFNMKSLIRSIRGERTSEFYYNKAGGVFAQVGGSLCMLSNTDLTLFDDGGDARFSHFVTFSSPALHASGKYGVAYDIGGKSLLFFSSSSVIAELESEQPVISARVNEKGFLTVCAEESGWGGSATVYNPKGVAVYKWYAGSDKMLSASVRGKNDLLVLTLGRNGSNLVRLSLDSEEEQARYVYDGLVYDACFTKNGVTAVSSSSLLFLSDQLSERGKYDLSSEYLSFYDTSSARLVLLTAESQLSSLRNICIMDGSGRKLHERQADAPIIDISVCGHYIAVLYSTGSVVIYDDDMNIHASYEEVSGYDKIMALSDGSAIVAGVYSARILSNETAGN